MIGSLQGLFNTGRQGLFAHQSALQVVSENIANVNTEGYSRQRAIFENRGLGGGVNVQAIERLRDRLLDSRMRDSLSDQGAASQRSRILDRMEVMLDETEDEGVAQRLREMFASFHDLSQRPQGLAERETVRSKALSLAATLNANDTRLNQARSEADSRIVDAVNKINIYTRQIADLNERILNSPPEDLGRMSQLLDERNLTVERISSLIDINSFTDGNGRVTVMAAGGQTLVEGVNTYKLEATANAGAGTIDVFRLTPGGERVSITNRITGGELGGALQGRNSAIAATKRQIDQFAALLIQQTNLVHRNGTGLDGLSGRDFFQGISVSTAGLNANTGGATVTASSVSNLSALTFNDYEVRFTGAGVYDVYNKTTGAAVSTGNAYASGSPIVFDGMSITISNGPGTPAAGDIFQVNSYAGSAAALSVSAAVQTSVNAIAAGLGPEAGDNRNALDLANLESKLVGLSGSGTLSQTYESILAQLGLQVAEARQANQRQDLIVEQTRNMAQEISGVSLDEESVNLVNFQRAFDASARVISVADELYGSILDMIR